MTDKAQTLPMTEQVPPSPSAIDQVIKDLLGFHDCADGDVQAGNGHFRLVCISDSDQQRLNLRAVLREAAHDLASLKAHIQVLEAEQDQLRQVAYCGWHPDHGLSFATMADTQQGATSRLMMTGIAGRHGWSVIPLYAALQQDKASDHDH